MQHFQGKLGTMDGTVLALDIDGGPKLSIHVWGIQAIKGSHEGTATFESRGELDRS